jgi:hypothetical protein
MGKELYGDAHEIYITCDGGGSNGSRPRLWKRELQRFANKINKAVHVSHFPPGTSKWNKIEHKMFCFISQNWRGTPLTDLVTIVKLIGNTKTKKGLEIKAKSDTNTYKKGIVISDEEFATINIENNTFSNNSGSLLITNISSENINTVLTGNVITRNDYIGRDRNGMFTSPVFFNYNSTTNPQQPEFYKNSVFENYSNLFFEDTLSADRTNIYVVGSADRLNISNNYFGNPKNKEIEKTFDIVSANFRAPTLYFNKIEDKPDPNLNGHFYKVLINGVEMDELLFFEKLKYFDYQLNTRLKVKL